MGSGAVLGLAPAPEYTFLIYVSPVGNYFKVCGCCLILMKGTFPRKYMFSSLSKVLLVLSFLILIIDGAWINACL